VSLDCSRKFRNCKNSSFAIWPISDRLCLENGQSIIEDPKPSGSSYGRWLGDKKPPAGVWWRQTPKSASGIYRRIACPLS
jgi:hypothetical protein